jgi:MoaA/NifB/PqqE/SkfB family radical SAM enzyme
MTARRRLPLVTLYATERCNSRCVTCDYWRHGKIDLSLDAVTRLLPDLADLGTQVVLLSGGEPLLNPEWPLIAELLKSRGLRVWLLTSGLSLAKHANRAAELFDSITVSLDGTNPATYAAIRGLDAFDKVCEGIRASAAKGLAPSLRVTVQKANYRELQAFVELAKELGARQVSFLAVDVANPHAFARTSAASNELTLSRDDLPHLQDCLAAMESAYAAEFRSGFIAESPRKLRLIQQYFSAVQGLGPFPAVLCNAPEFSVVVTATGGVQPCFFISGPAEATMNNGLSAAIEGVSMTRQRADIAAGAHSECKTCVCSMWRDPAGFHSFLTPTAAQAQRPPHA